MGAMNKGLYTDLSITSARYFLKFSGAWFAINNAEERRRVIALLNMMVAGVYFLWMNLMNIIHTWGRNISYIVYCCCNILFILLALFKVIIVRMHRFELADIVAYAESHFWHYDYDQEEKLIFAKCQRFCKFWVVFVFFVCPASLSGYITSPILSNMGKNKSDRELPIKMPVDWPISETPYFELLFTFQVICLAILGVGYLASDNFLCILNVHVICQFRILQYRMMNFWKSDIKGTDTMKYTDQCIAALKKCVQQHQSLIEFCDKMQHVFTFTIFWHMVIFSLLMGLNSYEIFLSDANMLTRFIFIFHVIGSTIHLVIFSHCCHGLMEESMNIRTTIYFGSWNTLPMDDSGRLLRSNVRMIMTRSLKPCCLTAGGFFPISLETPTTLLSSAVSYFTLMRNMVLRNEDQ